MTSVPELLSAAFQHHQAGNLQQAEILYNQVLQLQPNHDEAQHLLGLLAYQVGKFAMAVDYFNRAIAASPDKPYFYNNKGLALQMNRQYEEALSSFQKALQVLPDYPEAYYNMGLTYQCMGRYEDALEHYRKAIELKPDYHDAYNNSGCTLEAMGQFDEAIGFYDKALAIRADYPEAHYNKGVAYQCTYRFEEAIACYREAIRLRPGYAQAHTNLGSSLENLGCYEACLASYNQAIAIEPAFAEAHWNRALAWLRMGDYEKGWQEYRWRLTSREYQSRPLDKPLWDGSPLDGKRILVITEQGFGDTLQFLRYLPLVQERGGTVILEAQPELMQLLENCQGVDELVESNAPQPPTVAYDTCIHLLTLPQLFNTTVETIPEPGQPIEVDSKLMKRWQRRFSKYKGLKVGIAWSGNPKNRHNRMRACHPSQFAPLAKLSGIDLFSLQLETGELGDFSLEGAFIVDMTDKIEGFADTAAMIANLDLVISVDTVVVHLAGILDRPVWVLLPFLPDWRWMLDREDSPWYPSARLFRQQTIGDWESVFETVTEELKALKKKKGHKKTLLSR